MNFLPALAFSRLSRFGAKKSLITLVVICSRRLTRAVLFVVSFFGDRLKINWMIYDSLIVWHLLYGERTALNCSEVHLAKFVKLNDRNFVLYKKQKWKRRQKKNSLTMPQIYTKLKTRTWVQFGLPRLPCLKSDSQKETKKLICLIHKLLEANFGLSTY